MQLVCLTKCVGIRFSWHEPWGCCQDIHEVASQLRRILDRDTLKPWFGTASVHVCVLEGVRNWRAWIENLGISLEGALKGDARSVHNLIFMRRKDLPQRLCVGIVPPQTKAGVVFVQHAPHPLDVVLMVKANVWDGVLSQDPMVAIPAMWWRQFMQSAPPLPRDLRPVNAPSEAIGYLQLAKTLLQLYPLEQVSKTVAYLRVLAEPNGRGMGDPPAVHWFIADAPEDDLDAALLHDIQLLKVFVPTTNTLRAVFRARAQPRAAPGS